jgi:hypothetical protein
MEAIEDSMNSLEKIELIFASIIAANEEPKVEPGISEYEILKSFNSVGLTPTAELVSLYKWRNGIANLNGFLYFLPLSDALNVYREFKKLRGDVPAIKWKDDWFPVLEQNGDFQICLDLKTQELYSIDLEGDTTIKIAEHYSHYLDAMLFIFKSGQYTFDREGGCIEVIDEVWKRVLEKYNVKGAWSW